MWDWLRKKNDLFHHAGRETFCLSYYSKVTDNSWTSNLASLVLSPKPSLGNFVGFGRTKCVTWLLAFSLSIVFLSSPQWGDSEDDIWYFSPSTQGLWNNPCLGQVFYWCEEIPWAYSSYKGKHLVETCLHSELWFIIVVAEGTAAHRQT